MEETNAMQQPIEGSHEADVKTAETTENTTKVIEQPTAEQVQEAATEEPIKAVTEETKETTHECGLQHF